MRKLSPTPAATSSRRCRSFLAESRVTALPRATLSPATGLMGLSRKRRRDESPIRVKEETQVDLTSDNDNDCNEDEFAHLPIKARAQALKRKKVVSTSCIFIRIKY